MCNHSLMVSETDLPHQPDTAQQQATNSFKPRKLLVLIAAILLISLGVGTGWYVRNSHKQTYAQISPSVVTISPGWKLLQSKDKDMHFTLQYPSNLSLDGPMPVEEGIYKPGDEIDFNSTNPNGQIIGLTILYVTEDITNSHFLIGALLTAPVGNVPAEKIENYRDNVITKIADLTINGHRTVHATFFRKGGIEQQPRFCESYLVLKDSNHYYSLDTCTTNGASYSELQAKVTQYSSLMEQIVNTFTIK